MTADRRPSRTSKFDPVISPWSHTRGVQGAVCRNRPLPYTKGTMGVEQIVQCMERGAAAFIPHLHGAAAPEARTVAKVPLTSG